MKIVLGITGGIAAYKAADLCGALVKRDHIVRVIMTENATRFIGPATFGGLTGQPVMTSSFTDPMAHIEWAKWPDVAVIAPLTANTMAKLALGLADDALTTVFMAIPSVTPVLLAPAMNTEMWAHPVTQRNRRWLAELNRYQFAEPISKRLACGDTGVGGLQEVPDLITAIEALRLA